jgi:Isoleucyl-tRNA synthetase
LELSAFYLDILKDRLYINPPKSLLRRSAQTAMFDIVDTMVRLMAPIT